MPTNSDLIILLRGDCRRPNDSHRLEKLLEGFSQGTKTKSYFAPNGRYCQSRLNALNYMVTELKSSPEDVNLMREALKEAGWREEENLPEGWMVKYCT